MAGSSFTCLVPAYNEAPVLPALYDRLTRLADSLPHYSLEFLFVNDTVEGLLGYESASLRGKSFSTIVHEEDLVGAPDAGQRRVELLRQGGDVGFLVENGNDDRDAGRRCCHGRSMAQARPQFKRGLF